jgi:hypothetical protein
MDNIFPERVLRIAGEDVRIRALSFKEVMVDVPEIMGRILAKAGGEEFSLSSLITSSSKEIFELLAKTTGKDEAFWSECPAEAGLAAMEFFLEVNLTENFFSHLARVIEAGQRIGTQLLKSSLSTGTPGMSSKASR